MSTPEMVRVLVDDAGLFPPTALDIPAAVARHRDDLRAGQDMLTHRFLCPASRLGELRAELADTDRIGLGLITDTGAGGLDEVLEIIARDQRLELMLLEVPLAWSRPIRRRRGVRAVAQHRPRSKSVWPRGRRICPTGRPRCRWCGTNVAYVAR